MGLAYDFKWNRSLPWNRSSFFALLAHQPGYGALNLSLTIICDSIHIDMSCFFPILITLAVLIHLLQDPPQSLDKCFDTWVGSTTMIHDSDILLPGQWHCLDTRKTTSNAAKCSLVGHWTLGSIDWFDSQIKKGCKNKQLSLNFKLKKNIEWFKEGGVGQSLVGAFYTPGGRRLCFSRIVTSLRHCELTDFQTVPPNWFTSGPP